jgi:hypothetical protein
MKYVKVKKKKANVATSWIKKAEGFWTSQKSLCV